MISFTACDEKVSEMAVNNSTSVAKLKALIIDGQNNHGIWPKSTIMMKKYLEETGMFDVDINRTAYTWPGGSDTKDLLSKYPVEGIKTTSADEPKADENFSPNFDAYDVVINNFGWRASTWPEETKANLEKYMAEGGGLVVIHAANNSWGDWEEYNKMIGIGGWGGRNTASGPYVYYDKNGKLQYDKSEGECGTHGPQSEFEVVTRAPEHPIMKGLPSEWLHTKDELYERLRGPAENMTVLATAYSEMENSESKRTGRHEPMLSTIEYGKGRVFHTALGHMDYSMECVGFIATLQRGAEWAATGKVTLEVPQDFPGKEATKRRSWNK